MTQRACRSASAASSRARAAARASRSIASRAASASATLACAASTALSATCSACAASSTCRPARRAGCARSSTRSCPPGETWRSSRVARRPHAPVLGDRDAGEVRVERRRRPRRPTRRRADGRREAASRERSVAAGVRGRGRQQAAGGAAVRGRTPLGRASGAVGACRGERPSARRRAVASRGRCRAAGVAPDSQVAAPTAGAQARARARPTGRARSRGRRTACRPGPWRRPGAPALRAQELVDLGQLGADPGGLAAGLLGGDVELAAGASARPRRRLRPRRGERRRPRPARCFSATTCVAASRRASSSASSRSSRTRWSSASSASSPAGAAMRSSAPSSPVSASASASSAAIAPARRAIALLRARRSRRCAASRRIPMRSPSTCARVEARRTASRARVAARGQRLLGRLRGAAPTAVNSSSAAAAAAARPRRPPSRPRQPRAGDARVVAGERPPRLVALALDPLVQLGGLGLALERLSRVRASRSTSSARSRLSCVRSSLSCALAAALAVLAEAGGLLDQHPPVLGLGRDDLRHAALGDDGVHLLAQAGVRQDLDHVRRAGTWRR